MLDVIVVKLTVSEDVVHVMFRAPPFQAETSNDCSHDSAVLQEKWMSVVSHRVANPTRDDLGKGKQQNTYDRAFGCASDHQSRKQGNTKGNLT